MRVTQEEALAAVREVFAGRITRDMMLDLPPGARVYVAVAIMLALPQHYLNDGVVVGHFKDALDGLLVLGNPRRFDDDVQRGNYVKICRAADLYQPTPGRGGLKPIRLTPPLELTALVAELGVTPAALTFREDSLAGIAADKKRYADADAAYKAEKAQRVAAAKTVVERLVAEIDREQLWDVYYQLCEELGLS